MSCRALWVSLSTGHRLLPHPLMAQYSYKTIKTRESSGTEPRTHSRADRQSSWNGSAVPRTSLSTTPSLTFPNYRIEDPTSHSEEQVRCPYSVLAPTFKPVSARMSWEAATYQYCSPKAAPHPSQPKHVTQLLLIRQEQGKVGCLLSARSEKVTVHFSTGITKIRSVVQSCSLWPKHVPTTSLTVGVIFLVTDSVAIPLLALAPEGQHLGPSSCRTPNLL